MNSNSIDTANIVTTIIVFIIGLVIVGVLLRKFTNLLVERRIITRDLSELIQRIYEVVAVLSTLFFIIMEISPEYLGLLALVSGIIVTVLAVLFIPFRTYWHYLNAKTYTSLRGSFYTFILPSHDKPVHGRVSQVETNYTVIENPLGKKLIIPNKLITEAVLIPAIPTITLLVKVFLEDENAVPAVASSLVEKLKEFEHPLIKKEKTVLINEIGSGYLEVRLLIHPINVPVEWDDINTLSTSIYETLMKTRVEMKGVKSIKVEFGGIT
ncbi:hypothetical protein ACSU1N_04740 [Thermogladius sp. 4427co]|uniref:hypothetical protein n=1 Tax=Thermogladius sp. 4427co TaxID=3450718 RepID=UPI003F7A23DB